MMRAAERELEREVMVAELARLRRCNEELTAALGPRAPATPLPPKPPLAPPPRPLPPPPPPSRTGAAERPTVPEGRRRPPRGGQHVQWYNDKYGPGGWFWDTETGRRERRNQVPLVHKVTHSSPPRPSACALVRTPRAFARLHRPAIQAQPKPTLLPYA